MPRTEPPTEILANGSPPVTRRQPNQEIQVLARIDRILADMDQGAARRVVAYFAQREFGGHWTLTPEEK